MRGKQSETLTNQAIPYIMQESQIAGTVAGTTRDKVGTSLETLEMVTKPGSATSRSNIIAAHKIGLLTT